MIETDTTTTAVEQRWSQKELGSIRGAFTYTLLALQERLAFIPNAETKLVVPVVDKLDWDVSNNSFWQGTIMDPEGYKPSYSSQSPQLAMLRIILNIVVHPQKYRIPKQIHKQIELDLAETLNLVKIACCSRLTFTVDELNYLKSRILDSFSATPSSGLSSTEQSFVSTFLDTSGEE